jgi:hypothetical protein
MFTQMFRFLEIVLSTQIVILLVFLLYRDFLCCFVYQNGVLFSWTHIVCFLRILIFCVFLAMFRVFSLWISLLPYCQSGLSVFYSIIVCFAGVVLLARIYFVALLFTCICILQHIIDTKAMLINNAIKQLSHIEYHLTFNY